MCLRSSSRGHGISLDRVGALALVILALVASACGGSSTGPAGPTVPTTGDGEQQEEHSEAPTDSATLDILADEPMPVLLDGKPIGKAPLTGYKVQPGSHDVTFVDDRRGNTTMTVTVGENESQIVKAPGQATKFGSPQDP